jgi:hypothetical protein
MIYHENAAAADVHTWKSLIEAQQFVAQSINYSYQHTHITHAHGYLHQQ